MKTKLLTLFLLIFSASAKEVEPTRWGLGFGNRNTNINFKSTVNSVSDIMPLFYYKRGDFELDGLQAKVRLLNGQSYKVNAITKYRFFDIPKEFQNEIRGANFDLGLELGLEHNPKQRTTIQLLVDDGSRPYINLQTEYDVDWKNLYSNLFAYADIRSEEFNKRYYGLDAEDLNTGFEAGVGFESRLHLYRNFNLEFKYKAGFLDSKTSNTSVVDTQFNYESYVGIAFMDERANNTKGVLKEKSSLESKRFLRAMYAQGTISNLGEILSFSTVNDKYNNDMVSFAYGIPLTDSFFGADLQLYLMPIYGRHLESSVQEGSNEFVVSVKMFIPIHWPITWRIGLAEGISYVDKITYLENEDISQKGYKGSKLMNYLDLSLDVNIGQLFRSSDYKDTWFGIMIHHRSSIYESSSLYGRIKGGSNYIGLSLQQDF